MGVGNSKTPYEILGIPENAKFGQIQEAFRTKIYAYKRGELSISTFRDVSRAFECLSDFDKRKKFDETRKWTYKIPTTFYTLQQVAADYDCLPNLKQRLNNATLKEINAQDLVTGHTALYCAARVGNIPAVLYLIEKGAEPDIVQRTKSTALHVSAFYGHPEAVCCLLESGADYRIVNAYDSTPENDSYNEAVKEVFIRHKKTPFVQAAANQLDWLKKDFHHSSRHIDEQYYVSRQTLLHCASKKGYLNLVIWLVEERRSNLDIVDINLNSALHLAAHGGYEEVVRYLLERGANSRLINKWNKTAEQEGDHHSPRIRQIFHSIRQQNVFEKAIEGADWWFEYHFGTNSPNAIDESGTSVLYSACRNGRTSVAKWLLEHGANVNIQLKQNSGSTPLHTAVYFKHASTVELLLAYGADVNIKNNYGSTVFNEETSNEIKTILEQYRQNLKDDKLLPVWIHRKITHIKEEPIVKFYLRYDATFDHLLKALPKNIDHKHGYFSIAKRPLWFQTKETTLLTAVCHSRYVRSKFIDIPLHLTFTSGKPHKIQQDKLNIDTYFDYSIFEETFKTLSRTVTLTVSSSTTKEQTHRFGDLSFIIPSGSNDKDVIIKVEYINGDDLRWYNLPGCLCIFKTTYESRNRLREPPNVSFSSISNVRLYTLASPTSYWFTYDTRQKRLPIVDGIHGFFRHVDIFPTLLTIPPDMYLEMMIGQTLTTRNDPVPCKYLEIRKHNPNKFPLIAYHGTRIEVIHSILLDGLVVPGTIVANGIRVIPPANHIPLYMSANSIPNFAGAIFVSPSVYYSLDPVYATSFAYNGKRMLPILECSVKTNSYTTHKSTLPNYIPHPTDNLNVIEWRIDDPCDLEITGVLFVIKEFDQREKS